MSHSAAYIIWDFLIYLYTIKSSLPSVASVRNTLQMQYTKYYINSYVFFLLVSLVILTFLFYPKVPGYLICYY